MILASNLLCRLPNPKKFLDDIPNFLTKNGKFVLLTPFSWLEEYTPKSEWIGGKDGRSSYECLIEVMEQDERLRLEHQEEVPFLIREHKRKYQYGLSLCTVWNLK